MKKAAKCMSLAAFVVRYGGAGGNGESPSTFTKVIENQALNYAFQLHHTALKVLVDGCHGRAEWHGCRSLTLRTRVQFRKFPRSMKCSTEATLPCTAKRHPHLQWLTLFWRRRIDTSQPLEGSICATTPLTSSKFL